MSSSAQAVLDALTAALTKAGDNVKHTYGDTRRLGQEVGNYLYSALDKAGREVAAPALKRQADLLARAGSGPVLSVGGDGQLTGRLADLAELVTSGMAGPVPGGALGAGPGILPKVVKSGRNTLMGAPPTANNPLLSSANEVVNNLMPGDFFSRKAAAIPPSYHAALRPRIEDPIRVFHGSPHDFIQELEIVDATGRARFYPSQQPLPEEVQQGILSGQLTMREHPYGRFDLDKIGTGEGNQAYSRGFYFAEHEPVAKGYRDDLTKNQPTMLRINGKDSTFSNAPQAHRFAGLAVLESDPIKYLEKRLQHVRYDETTTKELRKAIDLVNNSKIEWIPRNKGHMYAANLHARPEQFLDWDRPLAQQGDFILDRLNPIIERGKSMSSQDLAELFLNSEYAKNFPDISDARRVRRILEDPLYKGELDDWVGKQTRRPLSAFNPIGAVGTELKTSTGSQLYGRLGGEGVAEETLRSAGIPGVRYLDQGSRSLGDGTHNYVVYDPNIIEIARKYALPAALAGSGAYMMSNPAEAATFTPPPGWLDVNKPRPPRPNKAPLPPEQGYSYPPGEYVEPPPSRTKGR